MTSDSDNIILKGRYNCNFIISLYYCNSVVLREPFCNYWKLRKSFFFPVGLPQSNGQRHVVEIGCLSLDLMEQVADLLIPHMPGKSFRMRIGLNTGLVS